MLRIPLEWLEFAFEWLEFAFEAFKSLSSGSNLHSIASNPLLTVRICIRMLRIPFEWLEFAFECLEFAFGWLEFALECFESLSSGLNLHSNGSNPFRICIRKLESPLESFEFAFECPFEWFKFGFECFESLSNG